MKKNFKSERPPWISLDLNLDGETPNFGGEMNGEIGWLNGWMVEIWMMDGEIPILDDGWITFHHFGFIAMNTNSFHEISMHF